MASWAKSLSRELDPCITINNILPGFTDTDRLGSLAGSISQRTGKSVEEVQDTWMNSVPIQRLIDPMETAALSLSFAYQVAEEFEVFLWLSMVAECAPFSGLICMKFDIFFSISQTPDTSGHIPSETEMFANFLDQAEKADELGFGVGWVAQAHFLPKFRSRTQSLLSHIIREKLVFVRIFFKSQRRCLLEPREWKLVAQLCRF